MSHPFWPLFGHRFFNEGSDDGNVVGNSDCLQRRQRLGSIEVAVPKIYDFRIT